MGGDLTTTTSLTPASVPKLPQNATCKVTSAAGAKAQEITCKGKDDNNNDVTVKIKSEGQATTIVNQGLDAKAASGQAQVAMQNGTIPKDTVDPKTPSGQGTGTVKATEPPKPVADKIDSKNVVTEVQKADAQFQQLPDLQKQLAAETNADKKKEIQAQIDTVNQNKDKILSATKDPAKGAGLLDENGGQTGLKADLMLDYAKNKQDGFGYQVVTNMIGKQTSASPSGDTIQYDSGLEAYKDPARFKNTSGMGWRIQSDVEKKLEAKALAELQERVNMLNNLGNYAVSSNPNDKNIARGSWGSDVAKQQLALWQTASTDPSKAKEWTYSNIFYADPQLGKGANYDPKQLNKELFNQGLTLMQPFDKNGDRKLDSTEFQAYFTPYSTTPEEAQTEASKWVKALDTNKDDKLDAVEYTVGNTMLADGFGNYLKQYADLSGDPEVARYVALADQMGLTNSKADYIVTPEERQFINAVIAQNPEFAALYQQAIINADSNNPGQDLNKAYYRYQDETIRTAASAKADGFERPYADAKSFDFVLPAANTTMADIHQPVANDPMGRTTGDINGFVVDVDKWKDYAAGQPNSGSISNIYWYLKNEMGWTDLPWETFRQQFVELNNIQDPKQWLYYPGQQVYLGDLLTTQFETSAGIPATP